jgi:hypothetical protein
MLPWQRILTPWNATTEKVAMLRWAWGVVCLFAFTTAIYAQGGDNREATTLILCFPKKFLKTEADPISATLIRYGVSKDGYEGLQVIHRTISGKEYDRGEQYKDTEITTMYNLENTLNMQIIWKGVLKTDPLFLMSGHVDFRNEYSTVTYTEHTMRDKAVTATVEYDCKVL